MGKLIIFDMDGTLIDSGHAISNAVNYVRGHYNLPPYEKNSMLEAMNNPSINSAEYFYNVPSFTEKHSKLFHEYYDEHCFQEMRIYDGIFELLEKLRTKNIMMSVATNANSYYAQKMLEYVNVKQFLSLIVGADMVQQAKPSSDMILYTLDKLNKTKENTLLIGDSLKDQMAAKNAGISSILVNWGFTKHEDAIYDIKNLEEEIERLL
jgi:phosphoglycolate phosphatase